MITKTAMITIAGRANVGKSTLTNKLTGEKVAITTPKPQTTRNRIYGVFDHGDAQMILMDTPGFHKAKTRLGEYMVGIVKESVADVDAVVLMVEPADNIGTQEEKLIEMIEAAAVPAVLAINKIDTIEVGSVLPIIDRYSKRYGFDAIIPISAKKGDGLPQLLELLVKYAKDGPRLFPEGMTTDQPEKQIIAEIIREKLLLCLDHEIPHGIAVEITKFSERGGEGTGDGWDENEGEFEDKFEDESEGDNESEDESGEMTCETVDAKTAGETGGISDKKIIIDVEATIYCDKKSHKSIIIGKNGSMLKKTGQTARLDIERFMGAKVNLQTWVKVKENWRDSKSMMKNFGYVR